eukprot:4997630-Alexandrium_andersonii.AAC.1
MWAPTSCGSTPWQQSRDSDDPGLGSWHELPALGNPLQRSQQVASPPRACNQGTRQTAASPLGHPGHSLRAANHARAAPRGAGLPRAAVRMGPIE